MNDIINILVTFDKNYIVPFQVMLKSLQITNSQGKFHIWLLHSTIPDEELEALNKYCNVLGYSFTSVQVDRLFFENAPIMKRYPQEMYYRLLAPLLLPATIDKVLYVDPDILVLNSVRPLWEIDLNENTFAAASHTGIFDVMNGVNRVRLRTDHDYFNSGVMLMDLEKARKLVKADEIFDCVREHSVELLLPDQDVFNFLYGADTLQIPDEIWNYDARYFSGYQLRSNRECDMEWVMKNTVFLHFCGKQKPWKAYYSSRFASLYKHYMNLALDESC